MSDTPSTGGKSVAVVISGIGLRGRRGVDRSAQVLLSQLVLNLPALALGFSVEVVGLFFVFRGLWSIFIHSNVRVPLGPLRYLFGAPEVHAWHHARHPGRVANFANLAPWCDLLSRHLPLPRARRTVRARPAPANTAGLLLTAALELHTIPPHNEVKRCASSTRSEGPFSAWRLL